jgi:ATP-binding cassette, subfamily F, member 3
VLWLQEYLLSYPNTIFLVSHDRSFLNDVCTDIVLFKSEKLTYYRGNFDSFEGTRREEMIVQQKQHEAQSVKMKHMQEFVDKFRFNAKRASLVQSRIKAIERETIVEAVEEEREFSFAFVDSGELGRPIIQLEGVTFGYGSSVVKKPLFRNVHKNIDQSSRIALVGPNGAGKSTLLKLIQGELRTAEGRLVINPQLRLGIFTQHHMDCFDLQASALSNMISRYPKVHEQDLRSHLGRFEIQGTDALKPMKYLSGGQKSKVAFANLTFLKPHVILLDVSRLS